jgi:hypothetical protein
MLHRVTLLLATLGILSAASAQAVAQTTPSPSPAKPGTTFQLRAKAPEPGKWDVKRDEKAARTIYDCKPLACPDRIRVVITAARSPTRNPDPKALEKLAQVDLPKAARAANAAREIMSDGAEKVETLLSETTQFHGYPGVINETKYSRPGADVFKSTALIFAGPALIRVEATSPDQALVKKTLADFIALMEFDENAPSPKKPSTNAI